MVPNWFWHQQQALALRSMGRSVTHDLTTEPRISEMFICVSGWSQTCALCYSGDKKPPVSEKRSHASPSLKRRRDFMNSWTEIRKTNAQYWRALLSFLRRFLLRQVEHYLTPISLNSFLPACLPFLEAENQHWLALCHRDRCITALCEKSRENRRSKHNKVIYFTVCYRILTTRQQNLCILFSCSTNDKNMSG